MPRLPVLPLALASLALSGCWGTSLSRMGTQETANNNYYSYVTPVATQPSSQVGLVVGSAALEDVGSFFQIRRVSDGSIVPVKMAVHRKVWRKLGPLQVAFLPRKHTVETREVQHVYAGAVPHTRERRRDLPRELQTAGVLTGLFVDRESLNRSIAFVQQYPQGWFVVALPPGEYQLVSLEGQWSNSDTQRSQTSTATTVTTRNYSVGAGPRFTVTAGRSNYIGSWHFTGQNGTRRVDEEAATRVVTRELSRINQTIQQWPLLTVGGQ